MTIIKEFIEYYYNFKIDDLRKKNRKYSFKYNNNDYLFLPLNRYDKEIEEINNLITKNKYYDQIVFNNDNKLITLVNNQYYVMIRKSNIEYKIEDIIKNTSYVYLLPNFFETIDRSNWIFLWTQKIDYIEYQQAHLDNKYKLLRNSVNYFIGMAENAISYVNNAYKLLTNNNNDLVISHKRIKKEDFNSPLNIIVDHRSRDIAEYLKYLFNIRKYDISKIRNFINDLNLDNFSYQLLYGRMLFPTFYFDIYDKIVNDSLPENEIIKIVKRTDEYEDYLEKIYNLISEKAVIEKVNWL